MDTTATTWAAYDATTEWWGPSRATEAEAQGDATKHNRGCRRQGGYGSAIVVRPDPDCEGRTVTASGDDLWPSHGRSCGTVRWRPAT